MEQKSGYVLQTALVQGENTGQHVSPSTGGNRKQCQVSKYIKTVNSGTLAFWKRVRLYNCKIRSWDPAREKLMYLRAALWWYNWLKCEIIEWLGGILVLG